ERIHLRPERSIELDWMLPAPAQGAVVAVCREDDPFCREACAPLHHAVTALCTHIERDFLRTLLGGCTTPISAYAYIKDNTLFFSGELSSLDGQTFLEAAKQAPPDQAADLGKKAAEEVLSRGGAKIVAEIKNAK
ncbi:MAG TPA: hydroxymethylbilane synthase, partial [Chitinophaga sp.]